MILKKDLIQEIEKIAPPNLAEEWDNCGMQVDLENQEIKKILVALEINDAVIREAIAVNADFIITHHPLIFGKLSRVDINDITGKQVIELIKAGISVYSAHTSFDSAPKGNNAYLAKLLELENVSCLEKDGQTVNIALKGDLKKPIPLGKYAKYIHDKLKLNKNEMRVCGNLFMQISKIGLCTGAGSEFTEIALENGCQLFITGDVKYHEAQKALALDIALIDAGHYGTEKFFSDNFSKHLKFLTKGEVDIVLSKVNLYPYSE